MMIHKVILLVTNKVTNIMINYVTMLVMF